LTKADDDENDIIADKPYIKIEKQKNKA